MRTNRATLPTMSKPPATYEDLEATPEGVRAELIDGELYLQASPAVDHQVVQGCLHAHLRDRFGGKGGDDPTRPGGWVFVQAPELWLGDPNPKTRVLCPDIVGWRRERWPRVRTTHGVTVAPDWVCEVLSPSTHRHDRLRKATAYAQAGVPWYWLLDPIERLVEVYELRDRVWSRVAATEAGERAVLPPFGGPEFDLSLWWEDLDEAD